MPQKVQTLLMEEKVIKSLYVLKDVSYGHLTSESQVEQEKIVEAMTQVFEWLHEEITTSPLDTEELHWHKKEDTQTSERLSTLTEEVSKVFLHWHKLQQNMEALNWRFWMLWTELGCTLDGLLRCCKARKEHKEKSCLMLVMTSRPPRDFSTLRTYYNNEKQVMFSRELWNAVIAKPLSEAPDRASSDAAPNLIEAFLYWMTAAMRGYELAFLVNVATPLREFLHSSANVTNSPLLKNVWLKYVESERSVAPSTNDAASVAVVVIVLSALTSTCRPPEVAGYLESRSAATVDDLSRRPFPQPYSNVSWVAMALGLTILDDARFSDNPAVQLQSENATTLSHFALLRLLSLPLTSIRVEPYDDETISKYRIDVHQRVKVLVAEPSRAVLQEHLLRMTEICIEEMIEFFKRSLEACLFLIQAMQSVLPADLFRSKVLQHFQSQNVPAVHDESLITSAPEVVKVIRRLYKGIAPMLEVLSSCNLVRSFLALSQVEFARKICESPDANAAMERVTQQLEQTLEQTSPAQPKAILTPVLRPLSIHSMNAKNEIPPEIDIIAGCQALAVGLVIQRKLRILLFQCAPLINDALSVAFSVLYNVFEPADAFGHHFIGVCLSHLAQFTPLLTVFPQYLQLTLTGYPCNASSQELTKACGAIFGSLFVSEALTIPTKCHKEIVETTRRMVLWAIRRCCERSSELLEEENDKVVALAPVPTESNKDSSNADEEGLCKKSVALGETDGLYLAGLVFELMKMAPISIVAAISMETERLLSHWKEESRVLRELKSALFARVSQNCEAEKRAWFAAWYINVDKLYPADISCTKHMTPSRL